MNPQDIVRFQVLTVASMYMAAFWDIALCSLIEVVQCFRYAYCLHHQGDDCPADRGSMHT
jgi:hypothetical protein